MVLSFDSDPHQSKRLPNSSTGPESGVKDGWSYTGPSGRWRGTEQRRGVGPGDRRELPTTRGAAQEGRVHSRDSAAVQGQEVSGPATTGDHR